MSGFSEYVKYQKDTILGYGFPAATGLGFAYLVLNGGFDRQENLELDRQEGQRVEFTTENTTGTSNLSCVFDEAGNPVIQDVDTGETVRVYEVQGHDGESCYFTDGPHRATGSQVFNAPILGR